MNNDNNNYYHYYYLSNGGVIQLEGQYGHAYIIVIITLLGSSRRTVLVDFTADGQEKKYITLTVYRQVYLCPQRERTKIQNPKYGFRSRFSSSPEHCRIQVHWLRITIHQRSAGDRTRSRKRVETYMLFLMGEKK